MIEVSNLSKTYTVEDTTVSALSNVTFNIESGKSLAICGSSGAGKSTLLCLLGGLDRPTSGQIKIDGESLFGMNEIAEAKFRSEKLGFVFQFHHLLDDFDILSNVMLPLQIQNKSRSFAKAEAEEVLKKVGLGDKFKRFPRELSGGEQQRAAIARAVVHRPKIILADEPTGNLDDENGRMVFDLLCGMNRDLGATLIVVTHHPDFAKKLSHILTLEKGSLKQWA